MQYNTTTLAYFLPTNKIWKSEYIKFWHKDNVPVTMQIVWNDYPFFKDPDSRFYDIETFKIPNPFMEYYKVKDEIK